MERHDEVLRIGVGVDDDVIAVLQIDGVVGNRLGVFADARVHVKQVTWPTQTPFARTRSDVLGPNFEPNVVRYRYPARSRVESRRPFER
ncbi:hypothetical protein VB779_17830 [Haloarculaceae archaeon H-GB11]|nr:hypothetical protein [Haloarculaceae archaeon H-GB11]